MQLLMLQLSVIFPAQSEVHFSLFRAALELDWVKGKLGNVENMA